MKKETAAVNAQKNISPGQLRFFLMAAVTILTFLSFSPALKNGFINWDDNAYVFENPQLSKPLPEATAYFFGQHYFIGNYIPVTMFVYALEYHSAALKPHLYHLVNLLIHLANVLLVFWFIYLLSGNRTWVAALTALFFGIHPMHVESVAWVSELKDVLYSFFFLAGLIAYYYYLHPKRVSSSRNRGLFPALVMLFFILSLLSKPAAVIFPLVLMLIDFYTQRRFSKRALLEKLPLFALSVIFGILAIKAQQADQLLHDDYPLWQRLLFASHSFLNYIVHLFFPLQLSIFYPYPALTDGNPPMLYFISPILIIALGYGVYLSLKKSRLVAFGLLFFLVNLVLVLQVISVGDAIMADRYTYLPYIGLFFILAMGLDNLYHSQRESIKTLKPVLVGAVVILALACSYATHARCKVWKDDLTIGTDLLSKFPDDRLALNNQGFLLYTQGQYQEAITLLKRAVELRPDYNRAYINLINSYLAVNDSDNAFKTVEQAIGHAPGDANLLNIKGYLLFNQKNYQGSIQAYRKAIAAKKDNIKAYISISECYYALKDFEKGIATMDAALTVEPNNSMLLNNKGYFLFLQGKYSEAVDYFKAALKIQPDYTTASINLADCYKAMNTTAR